MPEQTDSERREYERYDTDLELEVRGRLADGESFCDEAKLHNISGGGVGLLSHSPGYYSRGQSLNLTIRLPATDRLESFMLCVASVKWVVPNDAADAIDQPAVIGIRILKRSIEHRERQTGSDTGSGQT